MALVWILRRMLETAGSIEGSFSEATREAVRISAAGSIRFRRGCGAMDLSGVYGTALGDPGVAYFFPRPSSGSGCKRLNLFLRWMVRRDAIDLGVWSQVPASKLVIPLDTHVVRVGQCLQLTRYRSPGWRMAEEITASLRVLDPTDPVKYDFSLCHLG